MVKKCEKKNIMYEMLVLTKVVFWKKYFWVHIRSISNDMYWLIVFLEKKKKRHKISSHHYFMTITHDSYILFSIYKDNI